MTVSNNYAPDVSNGNAVTTVYTGNWKVFNASFFRLIYQDIATGIQTPKILGVDYTLTFDPNAAGYLITLTAPAGVTNQVIRARQIDLTQTVPYRTSKGFQGNNEETSFDKITSITQDLQDQVSRSLKFQIGSTAVGALPPPVDQAVLTWSGVNGTLINGPTVGQIANAATNAATATVAAAAAVAAQAAAEAAANGMKWRPTVRAATAAALPACTYANGASGVGATLTGNANGALAAIDGVTLLVNEFLLVQNQAAPLQNGVYVVTQLGTAGTPFILTRRNDADAWAELEGQVIIAEEGATNADTPFICSVDKGGTIGVTAITWIRFPVAIAAGTVTRAMLAGTTLNDLPVFITVANSPYTAGTEDVIYADASGGALTINLPSPVVGNIGKKYRIIKTDTTFTAVTIASTSPTFSTTLNTQNEAIIAESTSFSWFVQDRYIPGDWKALPAFTAQVSSGTLLLGVSSGVYRREGDSIRMRPQTTFSGATGTWGNFYFPLPTGLSIDTAKIPGIALQQLLGTAGLLDNGTQTYPGVVSYDTINRVQLFSMNAAATNVTSATSTLSQAAPFAWGGGDTIQADFLVPIVGWNG